MHYIRYRAWLGVFLLLQVGAGVSACTMGGGSRGPTGQQPSLIANYCFDNSVGTETYTLAVSFSGTTGQGNTSQTKFTSTETRQFTPPTPRECIETRAFNLQSGPWTVSAAPNGVAARMTCPATVPGIVTLDAKAGSCR
jgi:hypothetical protein